ncbi:MAG: A/G-specific adenine glycosylase [Phycisphaerae bacterium]
MGSIDWASLAKGQGVDPLGADRVRAIRRALLNWYDRSARNLPWRRLNGDVYGHWVAEVMLQQTQVETVLGYYGRFLERFPTVEALASSSLDEVLSVWQGLGYYRRAEHLHRAARQVVEAGCWPGDADQWHRLPGVGRYTAGAVASMALGQRVAAVDGNVARVLSRLVPVGEDSAGPAGRRRLEQTATRLVPVKRPGDFNQALMDLGAGVCRPRQPRCSDCPVSSTCAAHALGLTDVLPLTRPRSKPVRVDRVVVALMREGRVLLRRRPSGGRWAGLWELPSGEIGDGNPAAAASELIRALDMEPADGLTPVGTVSHALTHRLYYFHIFAGSLGNGGSVLKRRRGRRWVARSGLGRVAMASAHRKILRHLRHWTEAAR